MGTGLSSSVAGVGIFLSLLSKVREAACRRASRKSLWLVKDSTILVGCQPRKPGFVYIRRHTNAQEQLRRAFQIHYSKEMPDKARKNGRTIACTSGQRPTVSQAAGCISERCGEGTSAART